MYREVLPLLQCPLCKRSMVLTEEVTQDEEIIKGQLICPNNHIFSILDGIINFTSTKESTKSLFIHKEDDEAIVDAEVKKETPVNLKSIYEKSKEQIHNEIVSLRPKFILDISTGNGSLVDYLLRNIKYNCHIISTDTSPEKLLKNKNNIKHSNRNVLVTYIACDPLVLPFNNESIDSIVSFYGVANRIDKIKKLIKEFRRTLKLNGFFINTLTIVKRGSISYRTIEDFSAKNNIDVDVDLFTYGGILNCHKELGFSDIRFQLSGEGFGEGKEFQFFPKEGDWFGVCNLYCCK